MTQYLLGIVGHPLSKSMSAPMHRAALAHFGLEGDYRQVDLEPANLKSGLADIFQQGFAGFNVTMPHKEKVFAMRTQSTPEADHVQAVNTVRFLPDGKMFVHNTDLGGFKIALNEFLGAGSKSNEVFILGAGGAAKAGLVGLSELGFAKTTVIARNPERANELISSMKNKCSQKIVYLNTNDISNNFAIESPALIINSTPLGHLYSEVPLWLETLISKAPKNSSLLDMVYARNGGTTLLVETATKAGLRAIDGLEMLIHQAILAFEFWTGKKPPVDIMRNALEKTRVS